MFFQIPVIPVDKDTTQNKKRGPLETNVTSCYEMKPVLLGFEGVSCLSFTIGRWFIGFCLRNYSKSNRMPKNYSERKNLNSFLNLNNIAIDFLLLKTCKLSIYNELPIP